VRAAIVDTAVAQRVLAIMTPTEIALALAAADEVTDRRVRTIRALDLRVQRSRYEAARAERAFHQCEPENRLVARNLEHRWEEKLAALAEAEAAMATAHKDSMPLPPRNELEALALDLPHLWGASTTSDKDRKRLLRTLVADVTLLSDPGAGAVVRIGMHWRSGATETLAVHRPLPGTVARRTPTDAIALVRRLSDRRDDELVAELGAAGLVTGTGRPFNIAAVRWLRYAHGIPAPVQLPFGSDDLTAARVAARLHVAESAIYYWISRGHLEARRDRRGRFYVHFPASVEEAFRERVLNSTHIRPRPQGPAARGVV
jgi:hypothetical protein